MIDYAKKIIDIEASELLGLKNYIDESFNVIIDTILKSSGRLVVSGMGKSGHIGKKISATLASTGTPSFFIHPGEALHGDLGMVQKEDIILLLSNSGETDEVLKLIPFFNKQKNIIISMTGNKLSTLAKNSNFHISSKVNIEACHLQVAPTSSTTAALVMGDVLSVCLMKKRDFKVSDFAKFHPGGSLGRRLLLKANDVMKSKDIPILNLNSNMEEVINTVSKFNFGLVCLVDPNSDLVGIITDGDIRRAILAFKNNFLNCIAKDIMTARPITISRDLPLNKVEKIFMDKKINSIIVCEDKKIVGIVQVYNL